MYGTSAGVNSYINYLGSRLQDPSNRPVRHTDERSNASPSRGRAANSPKARRTRQYPTVNTGVHKAVYLLVYTTEPNDYDIIILYLWMSIGADCLASLITWGHINNYYDINLLYGDKTHTSTQTRDTTPFGGRTRSPKFPVTYTVGA